MTPGFYNLPSGYRGDTYGPIVFKFTNSSGNPVNLEGFSAVSEWRNKRTNEVGLTWSTDDNTMTISGNQLTMNSRCSEDMEIGAGVYVYDIQFYSGECLAKTYIRGEVPIIQDITDIG